MTVRDIDLSSLSRLPHTAKDAHFKRSRVYDLTKASIRQHTATMLVHASRGFRRDGLVPTERFVNTGQPALRRRRYSIDVVTDAWDIFEPGKLKKTNEDVGLPETLAPALVPLRTDVEEMDAPIARASVTPLPTPSRFWKLYRPIYCPPWNDTISYLELDNSALSNEDFRTIMMYDHAESWFRDSILNVALELLSQGYKCKENSIEITNSFITQLMYQVGRDGDVDENDFASYKEEKKRFANKKWIFLPINDGIANFGINGGTHWSFLAVNLNNHLAHYVDSLLINNVRQRWIASTVMKGLASIIGQRLELQVELNSPNQIENNLFAGDCGACGPFVYYMIKQYTKSIRQAQVDGLENSVDLSLCEEVPESFGQDFHSWFVRREIAIVIAREKRKQDAKPIADRHNEVATAGLQNTMLIGTIQHPQWVVDQAKSGAASISKDETSKRIEEPASSETKTNTGSDDRKAVENDDEGFKDGDIKSDNVEETRSN
jgi:hypothetical protein